MTIEQLTPTAIHPSTESRPVTDLASAQDEQCLAPKQYYNYTAHMEREGVHEFVTPQKRGLIALPVELRKRYGLDLQGAQIEVIERREDGVIELHPKVPVPSSQAWFWTEEWQAGEREAEDDLRAGRYTTHDGPDEFIEALKNL